MKKIKENSIRQKKFGFTLIELLVVISIIGILTTLLMANIGGIRERARDAKRKSDLNQIQKALEMYKNSQATPTYPASGIAALETALETEFMQEVPHDTKYDSACSASCWPDYSYTRDPDGLGDNLTYELVVCLENASDPQKDETINSYCDGTGAGGSLTRREL